MNGGGSTNTIQKSDPWGPAQPYLLQGLNAAQGLAAQGGPAPWIGPTFVGQTADQTAAQGQQQGYADQVYGGLSGLSGGAAAGTVNNALTGSGSLSALTDGLGGQANSALSQQLSGQPNYDAVNASINGADTQQWNQLYNQVLPQLNQRASFLNNPTGSIKDLNSSVTNIAQNQNLNAQQQYLGEYNQAQQQQQTALNQYGNAASTQGQQGLAAAGLFPTLAGAGAIPGQTAGQIADTGQAYQQQGLNDIMNQYGAVQQQPYSSLNWYDQLINGAAGQGGSASSSNSVNPGVAGNITGAIGGGLLGSSAGTAIGALAGPGIAAGSMGLGAGASTGAAFGPYGAALGAILGGIFG